MILNDNKHLLPNYQILVVIFRPRFGQEFLHISLQQVITKALTNSQCEQLPLKHIVIAYLNYKLLFRNTKEKLHVLKKRCYQLQWREQISMH